MLNMKHGEERKEKRFRAYPAGKPYDGDARIMERCRCCICGGFLDAIFWVFMYRKPEWRRPTWQIVMPTRGEDVYEGALAFVCRQCIERAELTNIEFFDGPFDLSWEGKKDRIKYAVEWTDELAEVIYHPVESLKDNMDELEKICNMLENMSLDEFEELAERINPEWWEMKNVEPPTGEELMAYARDSLGICDIVSMLPKTVQMGKVATCKKCGRKPAFTDGLCPWCMGEPLPEPRVKYEDW